MHQVKFFMQSAGGILLAAAWLRFVIATGDAQALALPDPVLGLPLRYAVLLAGGIELTVGLICLVGSRVKLQAACLAWLATNFLVYGLGLLSMHGRFETSCLGSLTDPMQFARGIPRVMTALLSIYFLFGSYAVLLWFWFGNKGTGPTQPAAIMPGPAKRSDQTFVRTLKIACTQCGGHIEFSTNSFGQKIPCPHCQAVIVLQKAAILKMSCAACDGHITFPAHALGEKIPCPHCNREITLNEPI